MYPELFKIPILDIMLSSYGVLVVLGIISAIFLAAKLGAKDGLPPEKIYDLGIWMVISSMLGAKLLMLITDWQDFQSAWDWISTLYFWRSGGVFWGGFVIAFALSVLLIFKWRLPWGKVSDAFAPGIALGHTIGRVGCFFAGCCWGKQTTSWFGVQFTKKANEIVGVPIHVRLIPIQLIEAFVNLLVFTILMLLRKKRSFDGQIILSYIMLYSISRFILEFWRDDPRGEVFGMSTSQFISILLLPLSVGLMIYFSSRNRNNPTT